MIGLETYKKSLGKSAETMSEKQILELRDNQDRLAEILFDMWLKDTEKKKQKKVIINPQDENTKRSKKLSDPM